MMLLVTEFTTERGEALQYYTIKRLRRAIIQIDRIFLNIKEELKNLKLMLKK